MEVRGKWDRKGDKRVALGKQDTAAVRKEAAEEEASLLFQEASSLEATMEEIPALPV